MADLRPGLRDALDRVNPVEINTWVASDGRQGAVGFVDHDDDKALNQAILALQTTGSPVGGDPGPFFIYRYEWPLNSHPPHLTWFLNTICDDHEIARQRLITMLWRHRCGKERFDALNAISALKVRIGMLDMTSVGELLDIFYPTWEEVRNHGYRVSVNREWADEVMGRQEPW